MIYQGGKTRIGKQLVGVMLGNVDVANVTFVDLFTGGNLIQYIPEQMKVIANDLNPYAIALLQKLQEDGAEWLPKTREEFTEKEYKKVKVNKEKYAEYMLGYVGFAISFGGKWFGGYSKNKAGKDYIAGAYRHLKKQAEAIKKRDIVFTCGDYREVQIPSNSTIYCDIPYKNTLGYKNKEEFNYEQFYRWCRESDKKIYISEYSMPSDFKQVWEKRNPNDNEK